MGAIADEQREQLDRWRARFTGDPAAELRRLLLLALEREQLVAIAYRDDTLAERLAQLRVPDEVRDAFGQALAWAWRDEQQHTVFTRGLLLGEGSLVMRLRAWLQIGTGAMAGWASSTQHHATWRRAPLARALAGVVTAGGYVVGKVPRSVRRRLQHLAFTDYCRMQLDAELSAAMCWKRMAELAAAMPELDDATTDAFTKMWQHEERHRDAFSIMADALDDAGSLREGTDGAGVVRRLAELGPMFVPRSARDDDHPLGAGGPVAVVSDAADARAALRRAVEDAGLREVLDERAAATGRSLDALRVLVKPTFMLAYDRRDPSVYTDPVLLDALVQWLREQGVRRIAIAEAPNLYDRFFAGREVSEVAHYLGLPPDGAELVDLDADLRPHDYRFGLGPTVIAAAWQDADLRIAFPKLRSHPIDFAHLGLGGLEGIAGRIDRYLFSERRAERETATVMPLVDHPPHFSILDGWEHGGDGLVGMIACRKPPRPRRIWAGRDALAVDIVAMRHLGLPDPTEVDMLATAITWFGDPRPHTVVRGCDDPLPQWRHPYANGWSALLALLAYPIFQYAGGRGALFAPPMDAAAFPPRTAEGLVLRARRAATRYVLGLRPPALPPPG